MNMGNRIKALRLESKMTQEELGEKVGVKRAAVNKWESGLTKNLKRTTIKKLSEIFDVAPSYLMGMEESDEYNNSINIPVYGSIPAGIPLEAIQDIKGYVDIPVDWTRGNKEFIALKVIGDSMYPKYLEGDTVIIQLQSDCETGQDCACYVNGYDVTLKRVEKSMVSITLIPINPNYAPRTYKNGEVSILGIVKELRRKI